MNKKVLAAVGGLAAFGILTASAASLGGLTSSSLGADNTVIASCDTDGITMTNANSYDATANAYKTTTISLAGVNAACNSKAYKLTLSDGAASLNETSGTLTVTAGAATISLSSSVVAESITKTALVISG